jgi:hypothetical protein
MAGSLVRPHRPDWNRIFCSAAEIGTVRLISWAGLAPQHRLRIAVERSVEGIY